MICGNRGLAYLVSLEIENMDWKNTCPTTADVARASLETLCAWSFKGCSSVLGVILLA